MTAFSAMTKRSLLWRMRNPVSIILTIIQPLIWLVVFIPAAGRTMGTSYARYLLPGLLMLTTFSCAGTCGIMNYYMKRNGIFQRILNSPSSRKAIAGGPITEAVLAGIFEMFILALVSLVFGVVFRTDIVRLSCAVLLLLLSSCSMCCISYLFSLYLPDEEVFQTVMNLIALPVFFTSGSLFVPDNRQTVIAAIIRLNPYSHLIRAVRPLLIQAPDNTASWVQPTTAGVLFPLILFVVIDILLFALCVRTLKHQTL